MPQALPIFVRFMVRKNIVEILIDFDRMKFLHQQLLARPKASVAVDFHFDHLRHVARSEPDASEIFYIARNRATPITAVSVQISDGGWGRDMADARTSRFRGWSA